MCLEDYLPHNSIEREIYGKLLSGEEITEREAYKIGENGKKYETLPFKYAFLWEDAIGTNGVHSVVFSMSPKELELVTKFPRTSKNWWKVKRGSIMQKKAHDLEVKVARPEGLYNIFDIKNKQFHSGLVMEHLGMLPINEIRSLKEKVCDQHGEFETGCLDIKSKLEDSCLELQNFHDRALKAYELAKNDAELKGFSDIDYRETNALWVPALNDIRMIDCDEWNYYGD